MSSIPRLMQKDFRPFFTAPSAKKMKESNGEPFSKIDSKKCQ
jgi:hypothetical protein